MNCLTHNTKFIINGIKCTLCTLAGFAAEDGLTVEQFYEQYPKQRENDSRPTGIHTGTCISSDPGYYEREAAIWFDALKIEDGEIVLVDGVMHKTQFKGRYSDAVVFSKV